jgi:transposase
LFSRITYRHQTTLKEKLVDRVEVDESYFGAKRQQGRQSKLKLNRGILKQPVFGVFVREGFVAKFNGR